MQRKKRIVSLILVFTMLVGIFYVKADTVYAETNISDEVINEFKANGYSNILYSSNEVEYATSGVSFEKKCTMTNTGNIIAYLVVPEIVDVHCLVTYNGNTVVINQNALNTDWVDANGAYILVMQVTPYVTGTLTYQFTFGSNTNLLFYVGQKVSTYTEPSTPTEPIVVNKPSKVKISKIVSSTTGATFTGYVTNISSDTKGLEYKVYNSKGKVVCSATSSDNELIIYGTSTKDTYYVKARAYCYDEHANRVYGEWSEKKYFISTPSIDSYETRKTIRSNSVTLKWDKVKGATKYVVYCSTKKNSGFKKVATTTKTSAKITRYNGKALNLRNKKYFKIYAYTTRGGKTIKSQPVEVYYCQYIVY